MRLQEPIQKRFRQKGKYVGSHKLKTPNVVTLLGSGGWETETTSPISGLHSPPLRLCPQALGGNQMLLTTSDILLMVPVSGPSLSQSLWPRGLNTSAAFGLLLALESIVCDFLSSHSCSCPCCPSHVGLLAALQTQQTLYLRAFVHVSALSTFPTEVYCSSPPVLQVFAEMSPSQGGPLDLNSHRYQLPAHPDALPIPASLPLEYISPPGCHKDKRQDVVSGI